jgi:hypothetical protein
MKRFLILFMILGLIAGSVATAEAKKRPRRVERTVEAGYTAQSVLFDDPYCWRPGGSCVRIEPRKGESFFTATAVDAHGQPVLVTAWGPETGRGTERLFYGSFCGETDEPIAFIPGFDVDLRVDLPGGNGSPSVVADCPMFGTTGTISVTLSNLP